ncbi:MAG: hypothetical protein PHI28_08445 [Mangrovibacterium sp.]|nr:hypothetical protein [Mangrovibacterium sp.]
MKILTTREFRSETKAYFELAEKEKVAVKRGKKYIRLVVTDSPEKTLLDEDWLKQFLDIPEQHRCNPFEISPSGDLFFADKRNVEHLNRAIKEAKTGKMHRLSKEDQKKIFGS